MKMEQELQAKHSRHNGPHHGHGRGHGRKKRRRRSQFVQVWKRMIKNRVSLVGFIIMAIIILLVCLAPLIAPYDPNAMDFAALNATPSAKHWFGTDNLGRDILSRLLWGGRSSLLLGFICAGFGLAIGVAFGSRWATRASPWTWSLCVCATYSAPSPEC